MIIALIPAYNEAKHVGAVVRSVRPLVDEVVVIDDASSDLTAQVAREAGATVLTHQVNRGQGAALETGHAYARAKSAAVVVHFDADGQFSAADITRGVNLLQEKQVDIVIGSRYLASPQTVPWFKRHVLLPLARWVEKMFGAVPLTDAHNGFRVLNERALAKLVLTQDRMAHATEIPQLIARHQLTYAELPIVVSYAEFGQGLRGGLAVIRDLVVKKIV